MRIYGTSPNRLAAPLLAAILSATPVVADQSERADELLAQLQKEDLPNWKGVVKEIRNEWSKSGSPAMDLLLKRGREALEEDHTRAAIEHLTALTDHAPHFAAGWHARATAYFDAGLHGPALRDLRITLSLNPRHFGALTGIGRILEETGATGRALSAYRAAQIINPHDPEIRKAVERLEQQDTAERL